MVAEECDISAEEKLLLGRACIKSRAFSSVAYCQILDENGESLLLDELVSGVTRGALEAAYSADDVIVIERDIIVNDAVLGKLRLECM